MSISLCMIVQNEAVKLPRCLESVKSLVDEIVVVDTGSTDQTIATAQTYGAKITEIAWPHNFAIARNHSLAQATGDWILVLDADEVLVPEVGFQLKALDQGSNLADIEASNILLVNLLRHEVGAPQSPYTLVSRFFRNREDIRFNRAYHETVDESVLALQEQEPHWQVADLPHVAIHHSGYQTPEVRLKEKFERARSLMEAALQEDPQDSYILNKLGALYGQQGDWQRGLDLVNRGLGLNSGDPITRYELHYHAGLAHKHLHHVQQAEEQYRLALQQPVLPKLKVGASLNLGSLLKQSNRLVDATKQFEETLALDSGSAIAYYNLGIVQRARGYLEPALEAYQKAIELDPSYAEAYQNQAIVLFKLGKLPECLQSFSQAIRLYEQAEPPKAESLRRGIRELGIPNAMLKAFGL